MVWLRMPTAVLGTLLSHCGSRAVIVGMAFVLTPVRADLIHLKGGGEIRGKIDSRQISRQQQVTITTLSGGTVTVDAEEIEFVTRRSLTTEEFETRLKLSEQTVEAFVELAEWCRLKNLKKQRLSVLERIVELDPQHQAAHRGLGHILYKGQWVSRDERMRAEGYVKHKGRYITRQQFELVQKDDAQLSAELAWYKSVRVWHGWLTGRHRDRAREGLKQLQAIDTLDAVPALTQFLGEDKHKASRMLYVEILVGIDGPRVAGSLALMSLRDKDQEVRYAALNGIPGDQQAAAIPVFLRGLKNELNAVVRRAAIGLSRVGSEEVVAALVDALVTSHRYRVRVPAKGQSVSFNADGSTTTQSLLPPDVEAALRTGQLPYGVQVHQPQLTKKPMRTVIIKREHRNQEVLVALQKITGRNFGYNERTWHLWANSQKKDQTGSNLP